MKDDLLAEIIAASFPPGLEEGEFTRIDYQTKCGALGLPELGKDTLMRHLDKMVKDGLLTKRKVLSGGKWMWAFKPTEKFLSQLN